MRSAERQTGVFGVIVLFILHAIGAAGYDTQGLWVFGEGIGNRFEFGAVRIEQLRSCALADTEWETIDDDYLRVRFAATNQRQCN